MTSRATTAPPARTPAAALLDAALGTCLSCELSLLHTTPREGATA